MYCVLLYCIHQRLHVVHVCVPYIVKRTIVNYFLLLKKKKKKNEKEEKEGKKNNSIVRKILLIGSTRGVAEALSIVPLMNF